MSRISPLHFVNAALVFGVMLAVTDAVAQVSPSAGGTTEGNLVYTACDQGQITKCGSAPLREECTFTLQIDLNALTRSGGFNFGGYTCVPVGQRDLFKDFRENVRTGVCYVLPRTAADGTAARRGHEDDNGDWVEDNWTDGSC